MVFAIVNPFQGVTVKCCTDDGSGDGCMCGADERVLRGYMRKDALLAPMTEAQRNWCLGEIGCVEGYDRRDYEGLDDASLARGVLDVWTDYCRDKGLL